MSDERRELTLRRYADGEITAEQAADDLGPRVSVSEVIGETARRFGRLPNRDDAFTRAEYGRGLALLGLAPPGPSRDDTA